MTKHKVENRIPQHQRICINLDCPVVSYSVSIHTMPSRLNLLAVNKAATALHHSITASSLQRITLPFRIHPTPVQIRWNSSQNGNKDIPPDKMRFPTQDSLPSVSEEAAEISNIIEKEKSCDGQPSSPELEQGSPVFEVSGISRLLCLLLVFGYHEY